MLPRAAFLSLVSGKDDLGPATPRLESLALRDLQLDYHHELRQVASHALEMKKSGMKVVQQPIAPLQSGITATPDRMMPQGEDRKDRGIRLVCADIGSVNRVDEVDAWI